MDCFERKHFLKKQIGSKLSSIDSTGILKSCFDRNRETLRKSRASPSVDGSSDSERDEVLSFEMFHSEGALDSDSPTEEFNDEKKDNKEDQIVILWKDNINTDPQKMKMIRETFFQKVNCNPSKNAATCSAIVKKSPLSILVEKIGLKMNPFLKYVKYDMKSNDQRKKILNYSIVIKSLFNTNQENYENIQIFVHPNTQVICAIGLILYKIESLYPDSILEKDPNTYDLFITDEDGVIDEDMPALEHSKLIGNYQFNELAISSNAIKLRKEALLNELSLNAPNKKRPESLAISDLNMRNTKLHLEKYHAIVFWPMGQSTLEFNNKDFTLRDLILKFYQKRGQNAPVTSAFYVEHEDNKGVPINLQDKVIDYDPPVFTLHMEFDNLVETNDSLAMNQASNLSKNHHYFHGTICIGKYKQSPVNVHLESRVIEYLPQISAKSTMKKMISPNSVDSKPITLPIASIISYESTPYRKIRNTQIVVVKYQEDKRTNKVTVLFKKEDADEFVKVLNLMQQSLNTFTHSTII